MRAKGVERIVAGDRSAIEQLAQLDREAWRPLVEHMLERSEPSPAFATALWERAPAIGKWLSAARGVLASSDRVKSVLEGQAIVLAWLRESVLAAFPEGHEANVEMRILDLRLRRRDDGGFAEARRLHDELLATSGADVRSLAQVAVLVAKGAFVARDYEAARQYASAAMRSFAELGAEQEANLAQRYLGGALLHLRQWGAALDTLDDALRRPQPPASGYEISSASGEQEVALETAQHVALWASADDPEWVSTLGGLGDAFAEEPVAEELRQRFESALQRLREAGDSRERFAVVIRQLRAQSSLGAAMIAVRMAVEAYPRIGSMHSEYADLSRAAGDHRTAFKHYSVAAKLLEKKKRPRGAARAWMNAGEAAAAVGDVTESDAAFDRARTFVSGAKVEREIEYRVVCGLRRRDTAAALKRAFALFQKLKRRPARLAESEVGVATVELLLDMLLSAHDLRAIEVQQALLDAKLELWGECPSAWLERHNLGTVYAQLGKTTKARRLLEDAYERLLEHAGPEDPDVRLCGESLARVLAEGRRSG